MAELRFKDLEVWKVSMDLVLKVYEITRQFPKSEQFGLASQLQRAAVSVPSNIAEASGRGTKRDFAHFLDQARGSLFEVITQLEISRSLNYLLLSSFNAELTSSSKLSYPLSCR